MIRRIFGMVMTDCNHAECAILRGYEWKMLLRSEWLASSMRVDESDFR